MAEILQFPDRGAVTEKSKREVAACARKALESAGLPGDAADAVARRVVDRIFEIYLGAWPEVSAPVPAAALENPETMNAVFASGVNAARIKFLNLIFGDLCRLEAEVWRLERLAADLATRG